MTIHTMPPQVAIRCDGCGNALGDQEDGYTILLNADAPGERGEYLDQHGWTTEGDQHRCSRCAAERPGLGPGRG